MYLSGLGAVDQIAAVWQAIRPEAINARVGSDGWWYDNTDNHKLSHDEAAYRQQEVIAAMIGASVDKASGWWVDLVDGHQLSHDEAWTRYQDVQSGHPWATPASASPSGPFAVPPTTVFPVSPPPTFVTPPTPTPATPGGTVFTPLPPSNTAPGGVPYTPPAGSLPAIPSSGLFGLSGTTLALGAGALVVGLLLLKGKRGPAT